MSKEKKYKANVKKFEEILEAMPFKKSDFDKNIKVECCGNRVFSYLSLGQKKYPIEIFEKLADEFTKQYKLIDPKEIIKTKDLIDTKNSDEGLKNFLMADEFSCVLRKVDTATQLTQSITSPNVNRVFINHTRTNNEIANSIEEIFTTIDGEYNSKKSYDSTGNLKSKHQINALKVEAVINVSLDFLLTKHEVNLYYGDLWVPLLSFNHESGLYEDITFQSSLNLIPHQIFLISYVLKTDPKVIYKAEFPFSNSIEATRFIMNNPLTVVENQSTGSLHEDEIKKQLQDQYFEKHKKLIPIHFEKDKLVFKNLQTAEPYVSEEELDNMR